MTDPATSSRRGWLEQLLLAQRGRKILSASRQRRQRDLGDLCRRLLAEPGEASALALAGDLERQLRGMGPEGQAAFLELLAAEFSVDPAAVEEAFRRWHASGHEVEPLLALTVAVEAPRQELLRRLNMAPGGTAAIVRLRARLLELLADRPHLRAVEADFRHLLASWFNRGFLRLEAIDWNTPAAVLERVICCEQVHPIRDWDDLRRRLGPDRRCFAFFHPALPGEPLIFVEVALTWELSASVAPLLDPDRPPEAAENATVAVFYSIDSCQPGLRGISFGNFLIKQVASELALRLPRITTFATISPLPGLAEALHRGDPDGFTEARLRALARELDRDCKSRDELLHALGAALASPGLGGAAGRAARRVVLAYLLQYRRRARVWDPVAHFHLANGARLERINLGADLSAKGLRESLGAMVNFVYQPGQLELNHERYAASGTVAMSPRLAAEQARVRTAWRADNC